MLLPPLNYQKPKSGWVCPSSSLSTQRIFQNLQNSYSSQKIFLLNQKILQHYTKYLHDPKKFSSSKKCSNKTAKLPQSSKSFSAPKFFSPNKIFSFCEESFSSTKFIIPLNTFQAVRKIFQLQTKIYCLPKFFLTTKNYLALHQNFQ